MRALGSITFMITAVVLAAGCSNNAPGAAPPSTSSPAGTSAAAANGLPDRDPALAHKLVGEGAVLLDVRTPEEYAGRHVDGAVNVPVDDIESRMGEIDKLTGGDKNKPIVVYCQAGGRAARAKDKLIKAGHSQVTNLGGIADWDRR